ncbi:hypothetical protein GC105_15875 [Alkalibaculum sp. M08DMB]|uniref:Uncharacterized protein n=1 Tax=Alkalibaculum sporogenes TaxID=2655001 RepID=A0A6A7KCW7_9FIRM|nr:hypothetical protein [Alkalibaculum sporogenes]MPW27246.1 hypothetical protein [Alkalibaculum sporogenes]
MSKIDMFIEDTIYTPNNSNKDNSSFNDSILIYGDNSLTEQVIAYCESMKYEYKTIDDIQFISMDYKYSCLLALSYNDANNLITSSVATKVYSIINVIALCNYQNNMKIYNDLNFIEVILRKNDTNSHLSIIKESLQNAVKYEG